MTYLTYIITCIAIVVVGRAFFSSDKKSASADTTEIMVERSVILNAPWAWARKYPRGEVKDPGINNEVLDSSTTPQDDETTLDNFIPPLIINEVNNAQNDNSPLPSSVNHEVTFFPQAPDANRNLPRQEACEEASIALANYFIKGKSLNKDQMRTDILALVDRQMELFGDYLHTTVEQTKQLYEDFYGWESYIIDNPSIDQVKSVLAQWHLIVAPFAWRKLGNPYYSGKWPIYHMMVLRWYDDTSIYTNDVGTSRGENYRYSYQRILDANHDRANDINQWAKRMLVITR